MSEGALALVLHTHMPYVEGFGTWPFGEEWLWEAAASCYVPLLEVLDARGPGYTREHLTVSLTPVLCDQLEAPGALERCARFLREVRPETHRLDAAGFRHTAQAAAVAELERSAAVYARAADTLQRLARDTDSDRTPARPGANDGAGAAARPATQGGAGAAAGSATHDGAGAAAGPATQGGAGAAARPAAHGGAAAAAGPAALDGAGAASGLAAALGAHATWTSSATHAILPLLALRQSVDLQLEVGIDAHRKRTAGEWGGGFWLPECAHASWLDGPLADAGIHLTCVELTQTLGRGSAANLQPINTHDGPTVVPIDRATIDLVWGAGGYPSRAAYRDTHRRTQHDHQVWANDGSLYDHGRAVAQAESDAREFVAAVKDRVADGGLCVCALDTELLGHWWHEGPQWLAAVIAQAERQRLRLTALDDGAIARHPAVTTGAHETLPTSSWGLGNDLRTWSSPRVADLAWQARTAELRSFQLGGPTPSPRALRELLALQSSDWAFMAHSGWAGDYPRQRASGHAAQLARALKGELEEPHVRNLAPFLGA